MQTSWSILSTKKIFRKTTYNFPFASTTTIAAVEMLLQLAVSIVAKRKSSSVAYEVSF